MPSCRPRRSPAQNVAHRTGNTGFGLKEIAHPGAFATEEDTFPQSAEQAAAERAVTEKAAAEGSRTFPSLSSRTGAGLVTDAESAPCENGCAAVSKLALM